MNKEKWIDDIVKMAKAVQPVSSNPWMATRIEARLQEPVTINKVSLQWLMTTAAVMIFLVVVNITLLRKNMAEQPAASATVQSVINEYGWSNDDPYSANFSKQ
ncbi:MAG: hypothetical protein JNJ86_11540 [Chitinophagaceae bacterium]|nr:hypothetical protein [Chitinophagaceae bacterium]